MIRFIAATLLVFGGMPGTAATVASTDGSESGTLKPWEVTRLTAFSPPERPGSSLASVVNVTISDPNALPPPDAGPQGVATKAICSLTWPYGELPYDRVHNCTEVPYGRWAFAMLKAPSRHPSPTTDFVLRFTLEREQESFVGEGWFMVGDSMSGLCSAGGICLFELKEESIPFLINQSQVEV